MQIADFPLVAYLETDHRGSLKDLLWSPNAMEVSIIKQLNFQRIQLKQSHKFGCDLSWPIGTWINFIVWGQLHGQLGFIGMSR